MVIGNYSWLLVIWTHSCSSSHKLTFPEPVENPKLILIVGSVGLLINLVRQNITNIRGNKTLIFITFQQIGLVVFGDGSHGHSHSGKSEQNSVQCSKKILGPFLNAWTLNRSWWFLEDLVWTGHEDGEEDEADVGHQHPHKHGKEEKVVHDGGWNDWDDQWS